jgi:serine/threonine protein phosphatase PrpC
LATKQLRLDVAQLTDVGRKREHNEDNMAYVIPKDQQVMAKKGALFIVADGMGGHAAGEVASEIAVDTVSNVYYQDDNDDVATSLLHAIKRANALIHQRAAENMLRSGMGTTCVAAVLRGNMAYIANVGDSRAYLVRKGQVKQISQDHSWVAEQVRAGLLTEDQARTHAQRNVITRCLGTQPDVEIDVFPEPLEESDALVLCTDGLSGLVSDDEIRRTVAQFAPQESVYHLIERANENGGPDNITAIIISVQEVGWEPPGVRHPVYAGANGRETGEDTAVLGSTSGSVAPSPIYENGRATTGHAAYPGGTLVSPDSITTAPLAAISQPRQRRSRLFYPSLALVILLILGLAGGIYTYFQARSAANVDSDIQNAQISIGKANNEVNTNPAAALNGLASAQKLLRSIQQNSSFNDTQRSKAMRLLQGDLTTGVQNAIRSYNKRSFIAPLCSPGATSSMLNLGTTGTQPKAIALVQGKSSPVPYALGADGAVYLVNNNSMIPVRPSNLGAAQVQNIVSNGSQLVLLLAQTTKPNDPTSISYSLSTLPVDQGAQGQRTNQLKLQPFASIDAKLVQNGQIPKWIAASGSDIYVVFGSNSTQTSAVTVDYTMKAGKLPAQASTPYTTSFSAGIESIAAFPNQQLFFLLADGSVKSLQLSGSNPNPEAISVLTQDAIARPLPVTAKTFTWQTAVPTVTTGGTKSLTVAGATSSSALVVGLVNNEPHLFILDAIQHRVLELTAVGGSATTVTPAVHITATSTASGAGVVTAPTPVTLKLVEQYASSTLFNQSKSIAVDAQSSTTNVLTQGQGPAFNLVAFGPNQQDSCD